MSVHLKNMPSIFRRLAAKGPNGETTVTVSISIPVERAVDDWRGEYTIEIGDEVLRRKEILGMDAVEVLVSCLKLVEIDLSFRTELRELAIERPIEGRKTFGFWEVIEI